MFGCLAARGRRARAGFAVLLLCLPWLGACSTSHISLTYPHEASGFGLGWSGAPRVFLGTVQDLRPPEQISGQGHFFTIVFPKQNALERPLAEFYRDALAQDLASTGVVTLVPNAAQATYVMSAEIFNLDCRQTRSPGAFLLPPAAGVTAGLAVGKTPSDRTKTGLVIGLVLMTAVPMPVQIAAESEVRLTLRDTAGDVVWQQTCRGDVADRGYLPVTAREDRKYAEKYVPRAVKRCNACLLGLLQQFLTHRPTAAAPTG